MPLPRRVHDSAGRLTEAAVVALVRRVWWSEPTETFPIACDRSEPMATVKRITLRLWWSTDRWPSWWSWQQWYDIGDRLEARTTGDRLESWLEVRRRWR